MNSFFWCSFLTFYLFKGIAIKKTKTLVTDGIIYCMSRVFRSRVSIQTDSSQGNLIVLVQPPPTLVNEANANLDSIRGVGICARVGDRMHDVERNSSETTLQHNEEQTNTRFSGDSAALLLTNVKRSLHELEQEIDKQMDKQQELDEQFSSLLAKMTTKMDEAQKINDTKYSSMKGDINNLAAKIEKLDEKP